jgi:hypothetical protein
MNEPKVSTKRYIGKVKNQQTQFGILKKLVIDNPHANKKDGQPDPYNKGALIWIDRETGHQYQVLGLTCSVPRDGLNPKLVEAGFESNIVLDLASSYEAIALD